MRQFAFVFATVTMFAPFGLAQQDGPYRVLKTARVGGEGARSIAIRVCSATYSPLQGNGNGIQSVYLTRVPETFAEVLIGLIAGKADVVLRTVQQAGEQKDLVAGVGDDLDEWEHKIERTILSDTKIQDTEREALIRSRRGKGLSKQRVMLIEDRCRITQVDNPVHLVASHSKPWSDCNDAERLNGENGLLLTPSIDHLFDRGFIGFEDSGTLIISPVAHHPSLQRMGVETGALFTSARLLHDSASSWISIGTACYCEPVENKRNQHSITAFSGYCPERRPIARRARTLL